MPEGDNSLLCICPVSLVSIAASRYAQAAGTVSEFPWAQHTSARMRLSGNGVRRMLSTKSAVTPP